MTKSRAALIIFLAVFVLILHALGVYLQLYWRLEWYDYVVHTMAGITAVLTVFSLSMFNGLLKRPFLLFLSVIVVSLIVGGLWELFELKTGITVFSDHRYAFETAGDIISDVIGGAFAGVYLLF